MKRAMAFLRVMTTAAAIAACGGCVLSQDIRYDDLDHLVHRATGKHLYDTFTEDDWKRIEDKAWSADLGDLVRITDATQKLVESRTLDASTARLTDGQRDQVRINLELALERVLLRVTDMRVMQSKREIHVGGCESSAVTPDGAAPGC